MSNGERRAGDPWFCHPCGIALNTLITAPDREDKPHLPPRCPDCNRPMRERSVCVACECPEARDIVGGVCATCRSPEALAQRAARLPAPLADVLLRGLRELDA